MQGPLIDPSIDWPNKRCTPAEDVIKDVVNLAGKDSVKLPGRLARSTGNRDVVIGIDWQGLDNHDPICSSVGCNR